MSEPQSMALPPRAEIASAWRRAELSGLDPTASLDRLQRVEIDRSSRLLVAAAPVLQRLAEQLEGTRFSVVLADREARIVDRRFGTAQIGAALDGVSAVPGARYVEELTGTNSIATTFELRRGVSVIGDEHYIEAMRGFCCYGHPIFHPITRRLEGVLDITGHVADANGLLAPFLVQAVHEIEQRLLQGSRTAQQGLLAAYQVAAEHAVHPVLVVGEGVLLANAAATELLGPTDYVVLKAVADDAASRRRAALRLSLASGQLTEVRVQQVGDGGEGHLITLHPSEAPRMRVVSTPPRRRGPSVHRIDERTQALWGWQRLPVLVSGEPGTGRTATARELSMGEPIVAIDAVEIGTEGEAAWWARLTALAQRRGVVVLEHLELLPPTMAVRVRQLLDRPTPARMMATSAPLDAMHGEHAALAGVFLARVELKPLRHNRSAIPALAQEMLLQARPGAALNLTPRLLDVLIRQAWPGNLQELRMVVRHLAASRATGDLIVSDLPAGYEDRAGHRARTPLEQSEYETILAALQACNGNKVQAARRLGIARATLYSRIRQLHIPA